MSYRSDVAIAIDIADKEKFETAITDYDSKLEDGCSYTAHDFLHEADEYRISGNYILIYWSYVKWYSRFPEVFFFNNAMVASYGIKRDLLRIGEDIRDVEEDYLIYSGAFMPFVSQSIEFNC